MSTKLKEFEEAAKKFEEEFLAVNPQTVVETKSENQEQEPAEPAPEPAPEPTPEPIEDPDKKYKDLLKGMNEAQRKAAEAAKAKLIAEFKAGRLNPATLTTEASDA